ncbi:hypothetical protein DY000_02003484 [Brassica cretica]|uniref:NUC153 domain-containing protein n=1 Tax=Brassica cretica TaxID=69181 RepID=A0ABQ7CFC2_BRACR|nr:hypothetical protein DY000_02003484 [Brassica cretica]
MADEKIPWIDPDDDSRFSAAISDHNYVLDPTNPRFKRSSTYFKQIAHKQKQDPTSHEQVEAKEIKSKEELSTRNDGMLGSKERSFTESATVKSLRLKIQQKKAELAQLMKKKAKAN